MKMVIILSHKGGNAMGEVFLNKKPVVEEYEYAYVETADGSIT